MKTIGRIILFIVGAILMVWGVTALISVWNSFFVPGWWNNIISGSFLSATFMIILNGFIYIIVGLTALLSGIFGRRSFWLILFAVIAFILAILALVAAVKENIWDWRNVLNVTLGLLLPIGYFVGTMMLGKRK